MRLGVLSEAAPLAPAPKPRYHAARIAVNRCTGKHLLDKPPLAIVKLGDMEKSGEKDQTFLLTTPAQWKAFSHPLRQAILQQLAAGGDQTNEELATALNTASGKLYFHTKRLLDAGLITLASTRQKRAITEKLYRNTATRFVAPPPEKSGDSPPLRDAIAAGLSLYESVWHESGGLPNALELGFHLVLPQEPAMRKSLAARLLALFDEFKEASTDDTDAVPVALTVLLHDVAMKGKPE